VATRSKEQLKDFFEWWVCKLRGTNSTDAVDYPDYAHAVAVAVADKTVDVELS